MFRKLIGVFTAVAAAGLLVGVAWASGDEAGNDSRSDSIALSAGSDVSSSAPQGTASDGTFDRPTSTSGEGSTSSTIDDRSTDNTVGSSTDVTIVDRSSTSTSVDSTTSTTLDAGSSSSTSSTIDDHSTVPVTTEPRIYDVHGAGSVTVQLVDGKLVLVDAGAAAGWTIEVDKSDGRDIRVEFENGDSDARFEAKIRDGEVRVEIRRD
ncbi:MAG TPA: hypothetical protein VLA91_06385 [Acidimicrobiia bacterium]|nr:hypothetical protein [Acidimicrobiia bacterium]